MHLCSNCINAVHQLLRAACDHATPYACWVCCSWACSIVVLLRTLIARAMTPIREGAGAMAQKQKHDSDSNMETYDALVLHLLHIGQELLGQKHGIFDRFSQEITLATQGKVHFVLNHQPPDRPSPAQSAYRFPIQFNTHLSVT